MLKPLMVLILIFCPPWTAQALRPRSIRRNCTSLLAPEDPRARNQVSRGVRASLRKCLTRPPLDRAR